MRGTTLGVEDRDEGIEVGVARGGQEGVDHVSLVVEIRVGHGGAPRIRRRARLASCRAAAGVRSTSGAISSKGMAKMSCRTNASRSAGPRVSRTTSNASPTESESSASCSGLTPSSGLTIGSGMCGARGYLAPRLA
jgi:hypothetical protein